MSKAIRGLAVLSHGLESSPEATKVSALAEVAARRGWETLRPDYRDLDAMGPEQAGPPRLQRLLSLLPEDRPLLLGGSSFGAFISGRASLQRHLCGLFLIATPPGLPGDATHFVMAKGMPTMLVHGWQDELCPVEQAIGIAAEYAADLLVLPGDHRLSVYVTRIAEAFDGFLRTLSP